MFIYNKIEIKLTDFSLFVIRSITSSSSSKKFRKKYLNIFCVKLSVHYFEIITILNYGRQNICKNHFN